MRLHFVSVTGRIYTWDEEETERERGMEGERDGKERVGRKPSQRQRKTETDRPTDRQTEIERGGDKIGDKQTDREGRLLGNHQ